MEMSKITDHFRHEFRVQSIVDHNGKDVAFEVLNRDPLIFTTADDDFIFQADIEAMSFACEMAERGAHMHFNIEPRSLIRLDAPPCRQLHKKVVVELVERGLDDLCRDDIATLIQAIRGLREAGFKIAMDDTTWTRRERYLFREISPDYIKTVDWKNLYKAKNTAGNTATIAEMVENKTLASVAKTLGADYMQGFHFETPKYVEDLVQRINARRLRISQAA